MSETNVEPPGETGSPKGCSGDCDERVAAYAQSQHDFAAGYFQHKETTAHAGLAVQLALLSALIAADHWPPQGLGLRALAGVSAAAIWVAVVSLIIHCFIRHQLRLARWAAIHQAASLRILRKHASPTAPSSHSSQDLKAATVTGTASRVLFVVLDHLFPVPKAAVFVDQRASDEPAPFAKAISEQAVLTSWSVVMEWFVTLGSALLAVTAVFVAITKTLP